MLYNPRRLKGPLKKLAVVGRPVDLRDFMAGIKKLCFSRLNVFISLKPETCRQNWLLKAFGY